MPKRGVFITFEGGEGAGKSTQAKLLAAALRRTGRDVVATREPGGAPGAEAIRKMLVRGKAERWTPLAEALLFSAARAEHVEKTIEPALAAGYDVVCDRFADSTMAYQGHVRGVDMEFIAALTDEAAEGCTPDLTLILDLPPEQGLKRAKKRGGKEHRFEKFDLTFHRFLRRAFLVIAKAEPKRCVVIDARWEGFCAAIHLDSI